MFLSFPLLHLLINGLHLTCSFFSIHSLPRFTPFRTMYVFSIHSGPTPLMSTRTTHFTSTTHPIYFTHSHSHTYTIFFTHLPLELALHTFPLSKTSRIQCLRTQFATFFFPPHRLYTVYLPLPLFTVPFPSSSLPASSA